MTSDRKVLEASAGPQEAGTATEISTPKEIGQSEVALIPRDVFQDKIKALRALSTVTNDRGEQIAFEGEAKEDFVNAFEAGYPVLAKTLAGLYELGSFLLDVRAKLRPRKLYHTWLEYAGIPRGTAQSYLQAYERYRENLPRFSGLGIKKLLIASRLADCVDYVEKHEQEIASQTAEELERQVKRLRQSERRRVARVGRKPTYVSVGSYRIRPSMDGNKITIEGLTKGKQEELIAAIKKVLSQVNQ